MKKLIYTLCILCTFSINAQSQTDSADITYVELGAGLGGSFAGTGIRLQTRFNTKHNFAYSAAIGKGLISNTIAGSVGAKLFVRKNLFLGAQFGALGEYTSETILSNGTTIVNDKGLLVGPSAIVGWDWRFAKKFIFSFGGGVSYDMSPQIFGVLPYLELGFSYRVLQI